MNIQKEQWVPPRGKVIKPYLPKAGFRWPENEDGNILDDIDREYLLSAGLELHVNMREERYRRKAVRKYLVLFFKDACLISEKMRKPGWPNSVMEKMQFYEELKKRSPFGFCRAEAIHDFFRVVIESRIRWYNDPTYPYDVSEHGEIARHVDDFLKACDQRRRWFWWPRCPLSFGTMAAEAAKLAIEVDKLNLGDDEAAKTE